GQQSVCPVGTDCSTTEFELTVLDQCGEHGTFNWTIGRCRCDNGWQRDSSGKWTVVACPVATNGEVCNGFTCDRTTHTCECPANQKTINCDLPAPGTCTGGVPPPDHAVSCNTQTNQWVCDTAWSGTYCNISTSWSCLHGGTLVRDSVAGLGCACAGVWTGPHCERSICPVNPETGVVCSGVTCN